MYKCVQFTYMTLSLLLQVTGLLGNVDLLMGNFPIPFPTEPQTCCDIKNKILKLNSRTRTKGIGMKFCLKKYHIWATSLGFCVKHNENKGTNFYSIVTECLFSHSHWSSAHQTRGQGCLKTHSSPPLPFWIFFLCLHVAQGNPVFTHKLALSCVPLLSSSSQDTSRNDSSFSVTIKTK